MKLQFFADHTPAPGGSKTAIPLYDGNGQLVTKPIAGSNRVRPVLRYVDDAKGNAAWRKVVAIRGKNAMQHARMNILTGPVRLSLEFAMPRPQKLERVHHTIRPDLTKLIRSTEDALTGIAWADDAQIIEYGTMKKRYAKPGENVGAYIMIEALEEEQMLDLAPTPPPPAAPAPAVDAQDSPFD